MPSSKTPNDLGADAAAVDTARSAEAAAVAPHVVTVELDPDVWMRGTGSRGSRLLTGAKGKRQQCCLGIALTHFGVPDERIDGRAELQEVSPLPQPLAAISRVRAGLGSAEKCCEVYSANDIELPISDEERVDRINARLAGINARIRFRLKSATATPPVSEASGSVPSAAPKEILNAEGSK